MTERKDYHPDMTDFYTVGCKRGESLLTERMANAGRTRREREKNSKRIARRASRDSRIK